MIHMATLIDHILGMLTTLGAKHFHWGALHHYAVIWTRHWRITITWR